MSFIPQNIEDGKVTQLLTTSATTFTKHDGVKYTSGYAAAAASGDNQVDYVSLETKTSASGNGSDTVKVLRVDPSVIFWATASTTPVQATHVGNRYDISAAGTIDLAASTDKIFIIDRIIDATNKIVEGRFQNPIV